MQASLDSLANPTNYLDNWSAFGDLTNVWQPSSHNLWNLGKSGNISHPSPRVEIRASEHLSAEFGKIPPPPAKKINRLARSHSFARILFSKIFATDPHPRKKGETDRNAPFLGDVRRRSVLPALQSDLCNRLEWTTGHLSADDSTDQRIFFGISIGPELHASQCMSLFKMNFLTF